MTIFSATTFKYFSNLGIRELVTDKHGSEGPGSTRSNINNNAIDFIWGSPGLTTTYFGYLPVYYGLKSDHRLIWVKISLANALGYKTLPLKTPSACKLCLRHPTGQHKYISNLRHTTRQHNLLPRLKALDNNQNYPPTPESIKEYKEIDKLQFKGNQNPTPVSDIST